VNYCINPSCTERENPDGAETCKTCGTILLLNERIRLIAPLRPINPRSYSEVFEVDDDGTRRVMKVLKWQDHKLIELLDRESLILRLLRHPGIPKSRIYDYFSFTPNNASTKLRCLVMDKVEGENLDQWIRLHGKISQSMAIQWLKELVEILHKVHRSGFFHRDIKPANIIVQPNGRLSLIDFGVARQVTNTYLAKIGGGGENETGIGGQYEITVVSSAWYSPLEQINGQAVPQSDFYALGRTFAFLVTGKELVNLPSDSQTGKLIWRSHAPQIGKPLADLIDELMEPAPGKRPQSTQILLHRLERLPVQLKINRVFNSRWFKVGVATFILLVGFESYKIIPPWIANLFFNQGTRAELQENNPEAALKYFRSAVDFNPDISGLISKFYFGRAEASQSSPAKEKKYYQLAIDFNPNFLEAYNNLALACQKLNDTNCIKINYAKAFQLRPNYWEAHYGLGSYYDDRGDYSAAEKQYKLAVESNGKLAPQAINNLSRLNNIKQNYNAAVELGLQGLKSTNDSDIQASLYKNLGWARLEQGHYPEAENYLLKAELLDPSRTETYCLLAQAETAQKKLNDAVVYWKICLKMNSTSPEGEKWKNEILSEILHQPSALQFHPTEEKIPRK